MSETTCSGFCADCGPIKCNTGLGEYPDFCLTTELTEEERAELMDIYALDENRTAMQTAARIEYDGYCKLTRVEETIEFAKRMGYRRLGIATCAGLIRESRTLARILRANGFEVVGAVCKAGAIPKSEAGIDPICEDLGVSMCNPIYQAKALEKLGSEFNIMVGLCVGHDSLFLKYSSVLTTVLVAKDRVTGHNPAAVLYTAEGYYKGKVFPGNKE